MTPTAPLASSGFRFIGDERKPSSVDPLKAERNGERNVYVTEHINKRVHIEAYITVKL